MGRYAELIQTSRELSPKEARECVAQLARDPRFAGVLCLVLAQEQGWAAQVADPRLAGDPGKLAHAAGRLHGLQVLLGAIRAIVEPRPEESVSPGD